MTVFPSGSVQLVAGSLILVEVYCVIYLWRIKGYQREWLPLSPTLFLFSSGAVVVLGSIFAAMLGMHGLLLAFALAGGIVISLLSPVAALAFFIAALLLRPWEQLPPNMLLAALPRGLASLCLLSWFVHGWRTKRLAIAWNLPCILYLSFIGWLALSSAVSASSGQSLALHFSSFFPITVICLLIMNALYAERDLDLLRSTLLISICGMALSGAWATYSMLGFGPGVRLEGAGSLWGNANDLAALIVLAFPFALMPLVQRSAQRRAGAITAVVILTFALWATQSRGGMLALGGAVLAYYFFCRRNTRRSILLALVLLALPVVLFLKINRSAEDLEGSGTSRWAYVIAGLGMVKAHPLFGVGMGNYPHYYEYFTPSFDEYGQRTAHSSWVLVLSESGPAGFILFAALYGLCLLRGWKLRHKRPEYFLALVSYGIAMSFLSHTYLISPYIVCAMVLAAHKVLEGSKPVQAPAYATFSARGYRFAGAAAVMLIPLCSRLAANCQAELLLAPGGNKPVASDTPELSAEIDLAGARGEVLNFIVHADSKACEPLATENKRGCDLRFFRMEKTAVRFPSYPGAPTGELFDPLIPLSAKPEICGSQWLWGEVHIARDVPPGELRINLQLGSASRAALKLTVWRMQMPEEPALPAYMEMTPWYALLGHFGKWVEGQEAKLAGEYFRALREHRIYPLKSHIKVPKIIEAGGKQAKLDLDTFPNAAESFNSVTLAGRPKFAYYDFPTVMPDRIGKPETARYFEAIQGSLAGSGRPGRALVYLWDEPKPEDDEKLLALARTVRKAAPDLKILVTTPYRPELEPYVDIYVPVMNQFDTEDYATPEEYRRLQAAGKEVWWYVSCMSHGCEALLDTGHPDFMIERPSSYIRVIGWLSHYYNIDAFLYYHVAYAYQFYPKRDPWNGLWDFSGNGDGTLFYPARAGERGFREHAAVPSIRLKLWREASYDAEYLRWMEAERVKPAWFREELRALLRTPADWERDYDVYRKLRDRIGSFLNGR